MPASRRFREKGKKMNINGVNYDSYLASIAQTQTMSNQQTNVQTGKTESDKDSYIPSIASADTAIPSGTYGANGLEVGTDNSATTQDAGASGGAGGAGGGSSDSEEETTTEVVTINGVTYLQTTTTDENGSTTVTRTQIG
jgi:hypothetical protein